MDWLNEEKLYANRPEEDANLTQQEYIEKALKHLKEQSGVTLTDAERAAYEAGAIPYGEPELDDRTEKNDAEREQARRQAYANDLANRLNQSLDGPGHTFKKRGSPWTLVKK